jgi:thymidylate synthase ThyX
MASKKKIKSSKALFNNTKQHITMTTADIFIHDEFDPEALAMMQALYSRSPESVEKHVKKVLSSGSSKFMESYYVGYGHASIGDCGTTTIFFEGVSILAAKAIQDNPLYSGQETSTRYIDFSSQPFFDPVGTEDSQQLLNKWIEFYVQATDDIRDHLKSKFPLPEQQSEAIWEKAINARSFDILRGYIPAGATTQLSWSTNLRQAYDKLTLLKFHPLEEVRNLAKTTLQILTSKYPSSFSHRAKPEQDDYYKEYAFDINYSNYDGLIRSEKEFLFETDINNEELESDAYNILISRPRGARLPRFLTKYGRYKCRFLMDYGSYRDLQRHRNGLCRIPLLGPKNGFNSWYLSQIPRDMKNDVHKLLDEQYARIALLKEKHHLSDVDLQYFLPMGANVSCELVYDLPEMVYVTELRSSSTVHPTLRNIAHKMHNILQTNHPALKLYSDMEKDVFDIRRGLQDIQNKS